MAGAGVGGERGAERDVGVAEGEGEGAGVKQVETLKLTACLHVHCGALCRDWGSPTSIDALLLSC